MREVYLLSFYGKLKVPSATYSQISPCWIILFLYFLLAKQRCLRPLLHFDIFKLCFSLCWWLRIFIGFLTLLSVKIIEVFVNFPIKDSHFLLIIFSKFVFLHLILFYQSRIRLFVLLRRDAFRENGVGYRLVNRDFAYILRDLSDTRVSIDVFTNVQFVKVISKNKKLSGYL